MQETVLYKRISTHRGEVPPGFKSTRINIPNSIKIKAQMIINEDARPLVERPTTGDIYLQMTHSAFEDWVRNPYVIVFRKMNQDGKSNPIFMPVDFFNRLVDLKQDIKDGKYKKAGVRMISFQDIFLKFLTTGSK